MPEFRFNANEVAPLEGFEPIPAGWYHAQITETELKVPKSGQGEMIVFTFEILDEDYAGQKLFENLNYKHPTSQRAEQMAFGNLSAICHATGVINMEFTEQLCNIPIMIKVGLRTGSANKETGEVYGPSNNILSHVSIERYEAEIEPRANAVEQAAARQPAPPPAAAPQPAAATPAPARQWSPAVKPAAPAAAPAAPAAAAPAAGAMPPWKRAKA